MHDYDVRPGQNIARWMDEEVKAADRMIGVFSDEYVKAVYSSSERWAASWRDPQGREGFLIPVEVEKVTDWPPFVAPLKRVSPVDLDDDTRAAEALLRAIEPPTPPDGPVARPKRRTRPEADETAVEMADARPQDPPLTDQAAESSGERGLGQIPFIVGERVHVSASRRPILPPKSEPPSRLSEDEREIIARYSPQIRSRDNLELCLDGEPRQLAIIIAARAALRVVPLLVDLSSMRTRDLSSVVLPVLRAFAAPWAAAKYPAHSLEFRADTAALAASFAASAADAADVAHAAFFAARTVDSAAAVVAAVDAADAAAYASANAEDAFWSALSADLGAWSARQAGALLKDLIDYELWLTPTPDALRSQRREFIDAFISRGEGWQHWLAWLEDRHVGFPADEEKELARLTLPEDLWEAGTKSIDGVKAVNAEIQRRFDEIDARRAREAAAEASPQLDAPPSPPPLEHGVRFDFDDEGLDLSPSHADPTSTSTTQEKLHARLRRLLAELRDLSEKAANHHPEVAAVVREYASLVDLPFADLDPVDLWAVGAGFPGLLRAYDPEAARDTMAGALEPGHYGLLTQAARIHGGFILGYPEVVEIAERGGSFAREVPEVVAAIEAPQKTLLHELAQPKSWIRETARGLIAAVDAAYFQVGWSVAETGYAAFGVVKNSLLAVSKVVVALDGALSEGATKLLRKASEADKLAAIAAACFLRDHAADILAFARPIPELHGWFSYVVDHLGARQQGSAEKTDDA